MARTRRLCAVVLCVAITFGVAGIGLFPAYGADGPDKGLAAYWNFDEGEGEMAEDNSPSKIPARLHGPKWVKGKYGRALSFDGKDDWVDCSNSPSLRIRGPLTVTAWIKPNIIGQQYVISKFGWNIYLGGDPLLVHFESRKGDDIGWAPTLNSKLDIAINKWSFVAAVYDPSYDPAKPACNQELYVNGLLMSSQLRREPIGGVNAVNLVIGRYAAGKSHWFSGLVDEARIYNRALSAEEIGKLYARDPSTAPREIKLTVGHVFSRGKVLADVDFRALGVLPKSAFIQIGVVQSRAKRVVQKKERRDLPASGKVRTEFAVADLPQGEYDIRATVSGAEVEVLPAVGKFTRVVKPSWLGSKEGITDKVLPPWTPIRVEQGKVISVKTWGHSYEFADQPLLDGIVTKDCSLLAGPVHITARVEGRPVRWRASRAELIEKTPAKVKVSQRAGSSGLILSAQTEIEYDGMMKIDCTLEPKKTVHLTKLTLELPLRATCAKYMFSYPYGLCDWFTYPGDKRPGALPEKGGVAGAMVPVLWLGNEDAGLGCFWESTRNWFNADPNKATEIVREGDRVLVRLHLVDMPIHLEPDKNAVARRPDATAMQPPSGVTRLRYTFALQATPVKPTDKTCWDYHIASCPWYGKDYALLTEKIEGRPALEHLAAKGVRTIIILNWSKVLAYTRPVGHEQDLKNLVREAHKRGIKILPYFGFQLSELAPEWPILKDEVVGIRTIPDSTVRGIDRYPGEPEQFVNRVCYNSVMQDFLVDGIARLMDEYDIDGVYLDTTAYPSLCVNRLHGCGYAKADGSIVGTHPVFAIRQTLKRIYTVVKTRKPDGLIDLHGHVLNMPALSWATSSYQGEGLPKAGTRPILDVVPLDHFRVEYMGHQSGVPAEFLHYTLLGPYPASYRKAWAISLLHDVPVRLHAQAENLEFASSIWRLFDRFGRDRAEWLPYWRNSDYLSVKPEGTFSSLYRHPKNGVLMFVSNLKQKDARAELRLNLRKLSLPSQVTVTDALSAKPMAWNRNRIDLTLPYLHWKLIWIRPK